MTSTTTFIDSLDDPRLEVYRHLKAYATRRNQPYFVVEGLTVTERLLGSGLRIASVLTNPAYADRLRPQLAAGVPLYVVPERTIETLVGFNFHRGVLACGFRPEARRAG